ncbi:MAG: hypothetical protein QM594_11005 [Niabella sp.]
MNYKCLSIFLCSLLVPCYLLGQPPHIVKTAEWFQKGFYILNPALAKNGQEIAFVRQLSGKDSTVGNSSFWEGVKDNYLSKSNMPARLYDPVITMYNFSKKQVSLIDYGWSPAFSVNDNRLAYAYQFQPLQRQDRLYADAYKGNTIRVFNTTTHKVEEVATPLGNYLLDPFFEDSLTLVYKAGDRVNGPYGAAISVSQVDLATKKTKLIRQPGIKYRMYELIGEPFLVNKKLAYVVYSPADSGTGMANGYHHLLLSGKDTIQNFGIRRFTNLAYKFAFDLNNNLLFLDDAPLWTEDTSYLAVYRNDKLVESRPLNFNYSKAWLSPGGKYMLYLTQEKEAYVVNIKDFSKTKIDLPQKEILVVAWSAGEDRLAVVQSHESYAGTDKLLIFNIR